MTLHLPEGLPTIEGLRREMIAATGTPAADTLHIGLLNLMPNKAVTERQFARALSTGRHEVTLSLYHMAGHSSRHTDAAYLDRFYRPLTPAAIDDLDGIIVTGAPVETLPFDAVDYWRELGAAFDRIRARRLPALHVCWASQAAMHHAHGIEKVALPRKAFGVEQLKVADADHPIARGLSPSFVSPVSRHTAVRVEAVTANPRLSLIAASPLSGAVLVAEPAVNAVYMANHMEYDPESLAMELARDRAAGMQMPLPFDYYPNDDPKRAPIARWRPAALMFFANWTRMAAAYAGARMGVAA